MRKYTVQVCMTYIHTMDVEAEDMHDAEMRAFEAFDLSKAHQGEGDAWILDIEGEKK